MRIDRPKYLFITADAGLYGSARSLQLLIAHLGDAEIDLVVAKRPFLGSVDPGEIRSRFGPAVRTISGFHLPLDYCYRGKPGPAAVRAVYELLLRLLWHLNRRKFLRFLKEGAYDIVHLNSLTLHRLVSAEFPCVLHVREIFDHSSGSALRSLARSRGVIFVDNTTQEQFRMVDLPRHVILPNPIHMTPNVPVQKSILDKIPFDHRRCTVFSVIGKITEDKGVEFIISCFRKVKNDDARLLIVGSNGPAGRSACVQAAGEDRRIILWGEEPDIQHIYHITDYVVRGEPYFCIGRTMYEGLYAGCGVIVPGHPKDSALLHEYEEFRNRIHFYPPRDPGALTALLDARSRSKVLERTYRSNVAAYARAFQEFVRPLMMS